MNAPGGLDLHKVLNALVVGRRLGVRIVVAVCACGVRVRVWVFGGLYVWYSCCRVVGFVVCEIEWLNGYQDRGEDYFLFQVSSISEVISPCCFPEDRFVVPELLGLDNS